jgi:hypothetical protein
MLLSLGGLHLVSVPLLETLHVYRIVMSEASPQEARSSSEHSRGILLSWPGHIHDVRRRRRGFGDTDPAPGPPTSCISSEDSSASSRSGESSSPSCTTKTATMDLQMQYASQEEYDETLADSIKAWSRYCRSLREVQFDMQSIWRREVAGDRWVRRRFEWTTTGGRVMLG